METIKTAKGLTYATGGKGLWSDRVTDVKITDIIVSDSEGWGEMRVYFDKSSWNVDRDGLIYSDMKFVNELRKSLKDAGYVNVDGIGYSEQGMQAQDYVSFDVSPKFTEGNF